MWLLAWGAAALAAPACGAPNLIDWTSTGGARWELCWSEDASFGIVLTDAWYTPPGGAEVQVLDRASLAEIHISYDDGTNDFFDVSVFGMGGPNFATLTGPDCPGGTLFTGSAGAAILCQQTEDRGFAWRFQGTSAPGEALVLWSDTQFHHYNFLVRWTFKDDGGIEPALGATGELAKTTTNPLYGWLMTNPNVYGSDHVHNVWWRLDFALGGAGNDTVEELAFTGNGQSLRPLKTTKVAVEAGRAFSPSTFRTWRVVDYALLNADGHAMSYEISPRSEVSFRGPASEPWSANDVWFTEKNACETYLVNNPTGAGCPAAVPLYVNGQALANPVIWMVSSFHHVPRDEDGPYMPIHWMEGPHVEPRDLVDVNPLY